VQRYRASAEHADGSGYREIDASYSHFYRSAAREAVIVKRNHHLRQPIQFRRGKSTQGMNGWLFKDNSGTGKRSLIAIGGGPTGAPPALAKVNSADFDVDEE
jgi:hypothetical protein